MRKPIAQFIVYDDNGLAVTTEFKFNKTYFNKNEELGQTIMENTVKFFQQQLIKHNLAHQSQYKNIKQ